MRTVGSNVRSSRQEARNWSVANENLIGRVSSHTPRNAREMRVECFSMASEEENLVLCGAVYC